MSASIEIQGLDPLLAALAEYPAIVGAELERATGAALLSLIPDLAHYPSPLPNQRYVRTGDLGRLWTTAVPAFEAMATGFEASIGNAIPYGPEVMDQDRQGRIFQGRWQTVQSVLESHAAELNEYFEAALERVAAQIESAA